MDLKNVATLVTGMVVAILMLTVVLMPVISTTTAETLTYTNEGMPYAEVDEDTHTLVFTSSEITVDGEVVDQSLFPGDFSEYTVVYAESALIRLIPASNTLQVRSNTSPNFNFSEETVTITITESTAVLTTTASSSSSTITDVTHYLSTEGKYTMALNPIVLADSNMYGAGQTGFNASTYSLPATLTVRTTWTGTIAGVTANLFAFVPTDTYTAAEVTSTEVNTTDLGDGRYRVDSVLINYTATDTSSNEYEVTSTYTYFLAPTEIVYNNPHYAGETEAALLDIAPLLITVGIIIGIVGMAFSRRE